MHKVHHEIIKLHCVKQTWFVRFQHEPEYKDISNKIPKPNVLVRHVYTLKVKEFNQYLNYFIPYLVVVGDSLPFVGLIQSGLGYVNASNPLPFKHIKTIKDDQWDNTTNRFTIREPEGIYLIRLNTRATNYINYTLMVSGQPFSGIT